MNDIVSFILMFNPNYIGLIWLNCMKNDNISNDKNDHNIISCRVYNNIKLLFYIKVIQW